jgi:hypothetical protein
LPLIGLMKSARSVLCAQIQLYTFPASLDRQRRFSPKNSCRALNRPLPGCHQDERGACHGRSRVLCLHGVNYVTRPSIHIHSQSREDLGIVHSLVSGLAKQRPCIPQPRILRIEPAWQRSGGGSSDEPVCNSRTDPNSCFQCARKKRSPLDLRPQQRWKRFPVGPLRDHATQLACPFTISRQTKPFEK